MNTMKFAKVRRNTKGPMTRTVRIGKMAPDRTPHPAFTRHAVIVAMPAEGYRPSGIRQR